MAPMRHQSESVSKWLPSFKSQKKEIRKELSDDTSTDSTVPVASLRFNGPKKQETENRKAELSDDSTDNVTILSAPVLAQSSKSEWPQYAVLSQFNVGCPVMSLISLDYGRRMAIICELNEKTWIQMWSTDSGQLTEIESPLAEGSMVSAVAASKDGKWIVSGYQDGRVVIWNAAPDPIERVGEFTAAKGNGRKIAALDISPDSSYVAIGSGDGILVIWSIENRKHVLGPLHHRNSSPVSSVKFSPTGGRIASGHRSVEGDSSIHLWHTRTGVRLESVKNPHSTYSLAWSVDGHRLFAGGLGGSIKCCDLLTLNLVPWEAPLTTGRDLVTICLSNSGQFLASVSSGRSNAIDIWDTSTVPCMPCEPLRSRNELELFSIASISQDDSRLISVGRDHHDGYHVTSWCLSTLLDRRYFYRPLSPAAIDRDPFTYVSHAVLEAWEAGKLEEVEEKLGKEVGDNGTSNFPRDLRVYALVNRALVRARRKDMVAALNDVAAVRELPNNGLPGLIACIAAGIAFHGQGKCMEALNSFKSALRSCNSNIFKCIKSITLLEHHQGDPCVADIDGDLLHGDLRRLVEARKAFLCARRECQTSGKGYEEASKRLGTVQDLSPLLHLPDVKTISLLFNWNLDCLISDIHELRCRALFESGRAPPQPGNMNYFAAGQTELTEDREAIQANLSSLSEGFGDEEVCREKYTEAIAWYSEALILARCPSFNTNEERTRPGANTTLRSRCPQCIADLLVKRSKVAGNIELWSDALTDATKAIENDPSYPWGYERKFAALHAQECFKEAVSTLKEMSSRFTDTYSSDLLHLRNYTKTVGKISKLITAIFDKSPFMVIDVESGYLCSQEKRKDMFESDSRYYELVSSMSTVLDTDHIEKVVEKYFHYVMFSHTWDGEDEPSFQLVTQTPVYQLVSSSQNNKLRKFCKTVRDDYKTRWSWSDTCCINKEDPDIHEKSIRFMYKWYHNSALTLVRLADPSKSTPRDSRNLGHNRWMFRAWTLQELLASQVIRFYRHDWELYLDGNEFNHKMLSDIKQELQSAMTNVKNALQDDFSPERLTVRQRLQLASTREATKKVDIAYALVGIFSSDIHVDKHREGYIALGLLLQEIVNRQGDVTVLDWIGQPSRFNSSIPAVISVYNPKPYEPYKLPQITDDVISRQAEELKLDNTSLKEEVTGLHDLLYTLGLPRFADRRLSLPCITFSVSKITRDTSPTPRRGTTTYIASTTALGEVRFETQDTYFSKCPNNLTEESLGGRIILVYPWIRDLLAQIRRRGKSKHDRVTSLIVYLEQGFRALLFAEQSDQQYRRVATDMEITVPACKLTSLEDVNAEMLEVWEKS